MVKKRSSPKRRSAKSTRRTRSKTQTGRIMGGLALLALLVVAGAVLAYFLIPRPSPRTIKIASPPAPVVKKIPPAVEKTAKPPQADVSKAKPVKPELPAPTASQPPRAMATATAPPPMPQVVRPEKPTYEIFPPKVEPQVKPPEKEGLRPLPHTPMVAIVVDDIGYDQEAAYQLLAIDAPLTFSVLPFSPFSGDIMAEARARGREILLHLPMEPDEYPSVKPGPGAILSEMSPDQLIDQLNKNIDQIPGLKGVNNHMGSRVSTSSEQMRQIFSILKRRGLFYIDSRTTPDSVAKPSADLLDLPFAERDIFIDHYDDPGFIQSQLEKLIQRAQKHGFAVGIGHPHANTVEALTRFIPQLNGKVQVVPASTFVQTVMLARQEKEKVARGR